MAEEKKNYPYNATTVFQSLISGCSKSKFKIVDIDEEIRRIIMSTSFSLLSYGETVEVIVQHKSDVNSVVNVKSKPKVFFNVGAKKTAEKNVHEIYKILENELATD